MACGSINASIPTHSRDFWIKLARYAASCLRRLAGQRALAKGTEERVLALVSQQKRHFVDVESRVRKQLPPTRAAHRVQENLETVPSPPRWRCRERSPTPSPRATARISGRSPLSCRASSHLTASLNERGRCRSASVFMRN